MQYQDYKQAIAADPNAEFDAGALSDEDRAAAEAFRDEMLALDEKIAKALAIDVPELDLPELPDLDRDENVVHMPIRTKPRFTAPAWIGIAASVAVVAVLGARFLGSDPSYPSLAAEVVAHLDHEPYALEVTDEAVPEQRLTSVVHRSGAEVDAGVGLVTYAQSCIINGKTVPHLVIQGKLGPITLLLMPDEKVDGAQSLAGENVNGVILPVGDGSIAIIGEREENLDDVRERVVDSVTFSI